MIRLGFVFWALLFASITSAGTQCSPAKITGVQVTDTNVVVKRNNEWHLLGVFTDPGMDQKLSTLLAAHASAKNVVLKFLDSGYECDLQTYSSRVYAVQVLD